jgi:hypothetical protein
MFRQIRREAKAAVERSRQHLAESEQRRIEAKQVGDELREIREMNHLAAAVAHQLRGATPCH